MFKVSSTANFFQAKNFPKFNHQLNHVILGIFFFVFGLANFSIARDITMFSLLMFMILKELFINSNDKKKLFFLLLSLLSLILVFSFLSYRNSSNISFKEIFFSYFSLLFSTFLLGYFFSVKKTSFPKKALLIFLFGFIYWFYVTFLLRKINLNPDYYLNITNHKSFNYLLLTSLFLVLFHLFPIKKKTFFYFFILMTLGFCLNLIYLIYFNINNLFQSIDFKSLTIKGRDSLSLREFFTEGYFRLISPYRSAITLSLFFSQFIFLLLGMMEAKVAPRLNKYFFSLLIIFFICLLLNWSKFNIVATFSLMVVWSCFFIKKRKYKIFLTLTLLSFFLIIFTENPVSIRIESTWSMLTNPEEQAGLERSVSIRYYLYEIGLKNFAKFPITGTGAFTFGDYSIHYPQYHALIYPWVTTQAIPHSDVINLLSETGIIGFILFYAVTLVMVCSFFYHFFKKKSVFSLIIAISFINYVSNGLTDFNFKSTEMIIFSFYAIFFLYQNQFLKFKNASN